MHHQLNKVERARAKGPLNVAGLTLTFGSLKLDMYITIRLYNLL